MLYSALPHYVPVSSVVLNSEAARAFRQGPCTKQRHAPLATTRPIHFLLSLFFLNFPAIFFVDMG
jgi:hypothetical protein